MASGLCAALTGRTHGCTDQPANVKKTLANSEPSTHGRLCCKSPKLPGDKFPATSRTNRRPAICVASIALPKSPVNSSSGDEVPHIFTRKSRLQPGEFLITSAKRLLQHGVIPGSCHVKAQGISSPGTHEAILMWPRNEWRAAMEHYVGLDVSLKQTSICVVSGTGTVVREGVVDSDPDAIAAFVRSKAPGVMRVGLETGPTA